MEEHIENKNSIIMSYLDLYELITFSFIVLMKIITYYKTSASIYSPILIFIILFISRLIKFKSKCLDDKLDSYLDLHDSVIDPVSPEEFINHYLTHD